MQFLYKWFTLETISVSTIIIALLFIPASLRLMMRGRDWLERGDNG